MEFVEELGEHGAVQLLLIKRLNGSQAGCRACQGTFRRTRIGHLRRISTDRAWAGRPSALASATAAGPIAPNAASSRAMKLVRFMKSSTESPLANRARRPVGRTWLGPAT